MDAPVTRIYEFAEWRLDAVEHLLLRRGEPVPLTPKVFETLVVLVENAGRLVPKDEFMKRVWPDAFVEEAALAQNISVLRKTLSVDDAHLIETVPKLGYRFLAKVQVVPDTADAGAEAAVQENVADKTGRTKTRLQKIAIALAGVALLVLANISLQWISQPSEPKVLRSTALTSSGHVDPGGGITIDGSRVYFLERQGARFRLMQTSVAGGEPSPAPAPFPNTRIFGLSPDGSQFLIGDFADLADAMPLSTMPAQGGAPHRIGDVMANDAAWFPDGKRILYSHDRGVFSVEADGRNARHLFDVNGLALDFSWRPDGSAVRFTVLDGKGDDSLWEASVGAQSAHPLLPGWGQPSAECCGSWMPDGRNYVFSALRNGVEDLWVLPEPEGILWRRRNAPLRLTNGPDGLSLPVPDKDGKRLFVFALQYNRSAVRFDSGQKSFLPYFDSRPIFDLAFSRDGKWVAYISSAGALWRSKTDGTEPLQLTSPPLFALRPRWSPDGSQILFMGRNLGTVNSAYLVSANGGAIAPVLKEGIANFGQADWSPDGESVALDATSESGTEDGISVVHLRTRRRSSIPESKGKVYVRWSPDGRYLAARSTDEKNLFLFDFHSQQWRHLAAARYIPRHEWDPNSRDLYFQDALDPAETVFRVNVEDSKVEPVFDFSKIVQSGAVRCTFEGRAPDGSYLASVRTSVSNIYALDVDIP